MASLLGINGPRAPLASKLFMDLQFICKPHTPYTERDFASYLIQGTDARHTHKNSCMLLSGDNSDPLETLSVSLLGRVAGRGLTGV